jgi:predicted transcriptional regulator
MKMARRTPKYTRDKITEIHIENRADGRCKLVRQLLAEFKEENEDLYDHQTELDAKAEEYETIAKQLREQSKETGEEITRRKQEAGLVHTSREKVTTGGCRLVYPHPDLVAYDKKTDSDLVHILTDEIVNPADYGMVEA